VRNDLKAMNVTDWKELPLNGKAWNDLVEKASSQKGL
jgi:hypothetical protein